MPVIKDLLRRKKNFFLTVFIFVINYYYIFFSSFLIIIKSGCECYKPRIATFSIINTTSQQTLDLEIDSKFDPTSASDNPFSNFLASVQAAYFWINGVWSQRNNWDYWAVEVMSLIASILLVTVLQNILIALKR